MENIKIGARIKQAREAKDMSQEELGTQLGLNKSTIQRYESGQVQRIKLPILENMAKILGVNPNWLVLKSDDPEPYREPSNLSYVVDNKTNDPGESYIVIAKDEQELLNDYRLLNDLGKGEARKRINELTKLEQYKSSDDSEEEIFISVAARKARTNNRKLKKRNSNIKPSDLPDYKG